MIEINLVVGLRRHDELSVMRLKCVAWIGNRFNLTPVPRFVGAVGHIAEHFAGRLALRRQAELPWVAVIVIEVTPCRLRIDMNPSSTDSTDVAHLAPRDFHDILDQIRDSPEQLRMRQTQTMLMWKSWALFFLFALILAGAISTWSLGRPWWMTIGLVVVSVAILIGARYFSAQALLCAKEQERRYVLACLRAAQTIDELSEAGLFAWLSTAAGADLDRAIQNEAHRLRKALETRSGALT